MIFSLEVSPQPLRIHPADGLRQRVQGARIPPASVTLRPMGNSPAGF
jgi:hypothetical protein